MSTAASVREQALHDIVRQLGPTRVGQRLGLDGITSLEDFRQSVPIFDRAGHEREVENLLGFGAIDDANPAAMTTGGAEHERDAVLEVWRARLGDAPVRRTALLLAPGRDPLAERTLRDDLRALGGELFVLDRIDDAARALERLRTFDPDLLVAPSLMVCAWLERSQRLALGRQLPSLRAVLCEHDLGRPARLDVPTLGIGWFHRGLRCGLPSVRAPDDAVTLAVGSQLLELLPYTNPEDDGRRVYAEHTILPEAAFLGHRYEVVVSSALGMIRLRTEQHVRVVGFDPPTPLAPWPRARVVRLSTPPPDVALEGCTVAGAWLTASVRQSLAPEDPALVAAEIGPDPQTIGPRTTSGSSSSMRRLGGLGDTEFGEITLRGATVPAPGRPRGLLCRIELQGLVRPDLSRRVSTRIDESLRLRSPAYAYLRERGELGPPRVIVLPAGTSASEQRRRITELDGAVWMPDVRVVA